MKKRTPMEYALYLLSRRPRTEKEIIVALKKRKVTEEEIPMIVEKLKEWGYLNDREYARDFVRVKMRKIYGPPVIKSELIKRGISPEIAEDAIRLEYDEELVKKLAAERIKKMLGTNPDEKIIRRTWNFLTRRGLPASDILNLAMEHTG